VRSGHSVNRDLGAALKRAAQRTGEQTPSVRGSDWAGAVVTAVNADGTVDAGDLEDVRCMETYIQPAVGDLIYITQSSSGNWLAWGRAATGDDPIGGILVAPKTTDTARTSTATTTGDPQLLLKVPAGAV
jgi:hypothetical protein